MVVPDEVRRGVVSQLNDQAGEKVAVKAVLCLQRSGEVSGPAGIRVRDRVAGVPVGAAARVAGRIYGKAAERAPGPAGGNDFS